MKRQLTATTPAPPRPGVSGGALSDGRAVMAQLDDWVSRHGNGKYERGDWEPMKDFAIPDDAGIQQDRREIAEFVEVLLRRPQRERVLEIGLGYFGSTHFLWRQLFERVTTVEKSHDRVRTFGTNMRAFHGQWVLNDRRSAFLIGWSYEPATVHKAFTHLPEGVDLLFIDGDHQYASVLTDWLLYSPLVRPGGLVAFHDVGLQGGTYGVAEFVAHLAEGRIDGRPRALTTIRHTKNLGIAFYEQPEPHASQRKPAARVAAR
jgi:predicted O-methyltransferase YrrM